MYYGSLGVLGNSGLCGPPGYLLHVGPKQSLGGCMKALMLLEVDTGIDAFAEN